MDKNRIPGPDAEYTTRHREFQNQFDCDFRLSKRDAWKSNGSFHTAGKRRVRFMYTQRLKELRKQHHLSQEELANILHCSQRAYSHWENGVRHLPIDMLIALAQYYHISTDYILGLSDEGYIYLYGENQGNRYF